MLNGESADIFIFQLGPECRCNLGIAPDVDERWEYPGPVPCGIHAVWFALASRRYYSGRDLNLNSLRLLTEIL